MVRENARLQSEVDTANTEHDEVMARITEMERQVEQIPELAEQQARTIIEQRKAQHEVEMRRLRKNHDDHILSLRAEYDRLPKEYRSLESSSESTINRLEREKSELLARIKAMLEMLNNVLKEAVRAVVEFSKSVLREFSMKHREAVAEYLAASPDVANAANLIKVFARPFLDDRQFYKGSRELNRLTSGFPSVQEDMNRERNHGVRL